MKIYLVGGAVRDALLGLPVKDRDWVVVGATADQMIELGYKQVGADFPVFLHPDTGEEYALARIERKTGDGYHGFTTETSNVTLEQDLSRRDLTINSMAMAEDGTIIDPFGGQTDLRNRILRHTSDAFAEDPLRVLRLMRFHARYGNFTTDQNTIKLAVDLIESGRLNELSYERFWAELEKVIHEASSWKFFDYMLGWKMIEHVTFFNKLYGEHRPYLDSTWFHTMFFDGSKMVLNLPIDKRLMVFMAMTMHNRPIDDDVRLERHTQILHSCANKFFDITMGEPDAVTEELYKLMKTLKPWGEGPAYDNLILAVETMNPHTPDDYFFSAKTLVALRDAINTVKSEHFPQFQGKELGAKIEEARKAKITEVIQSLK